MGIVMALINGIKKTIRLAKIARAVNKDKRTILYIAIAKIKQYLLMFFKSFMYEFLLIGVVLIVLIMSVGAIYQFFSFDFHGDSDAVYNFIPKDLEEEIEEPKDENCCPSADPYGRQLRANLENWSKTITKRDIEEMQKAGGGVHPKKSVEYLDIELDSYEDNVLIRIPVEIETFVDGSSVGIEELDEKYCFKRGDSAYPYRLWWQSLAGLDSINDTALKEKDNKLIRSAAKELDPYFLWTDPMTEDYAYLDKYKRSSPYELIIKNTVTTIIDNYVDGEFVSQTEIVVVTTKWYPLPLLIQATTMFKDTSNMLGKTFTEVAGEPIVSEESRIEVEERTGTKKELQEIDGETVEVEVEYDYEVEIVYTTVTTVTEKENTESWAIAMQLTQHLPTFFDFLVDNEIETETDPEVMYYMVETLPQNFDFVREYGEYLEYASGERLGGFRGGIKGGFSNITMVDYEISPSELIRDIPLFIQTDKRWGYVPYSYTNNPIHGTIGTSACGPTSMAMAITGLGGYSTDIDLNNDKIIDPYEASKYSLDRGHRIYGSGTSWAYFKDIGERTGLKVSQVSTRFYKEVLEALRVGNPVIASMGPGTFTKAGHYITLVGIDSSGRIIVNDSNSVSRSNQSWSFERIILPQAKQFWIVGK